MSPLYSLARETKQASWKYSSKRKRISFSIASNCQRINSEKSISHLCTGRRLWLYFLSLLSEHIFWEDSSQETREQDTWETGEREVNTKSCERQQQKQMKDKNNTGRDGVSRCDGHLARLMRGWWELLILLLVIWQASVLLVSGRTVCPGMQKKRERERETGEKEATVSCKKVSRSGADKIWHSVSCRWEEKRFEERRLLRLLKRHWH